MFHVRTASTGGRAASRPRVGKTVGASWLLPGGHVELLWSFPWGAGMRLRAILVLAIWLLAASLVDAKGGGGRSSGGRSSGSTGSTRSSGGTGSQYVSSGRYTSSGASIPAGCRGCYYRGTTGGFYSRVFIFYYLGSTYRCYSCGSRSYERYSTDSMHVTLASVQGEFEVKLRDQTGNPGATQLTLVDVNSTTTMSSAGVAFESSMRDKVVSDWAQWSASSTEPVATTASLGLADDIAISVATAPDSCTGPPPCEPRVTVSFMVLFEDPSDATSGRAASHMGTLKASCLNEAECAGCGVPSSASDARADACTTGTGCSAACAECVSTLDCTGVLPSGRHKGLWDSSSECTHVADNPLYTVSSCSVFQVEAIQLSSELGEELPYDYEEDDSGWGLGIILLIVLALCCGCWICAKIDGGRKKQQNPARMAGQGPLRETPSQFQLPPQQLAAMPVATAVAVPTQHVQTMPVVQPQQAKP